MGGTMSRRRLEQRGGAEAIIGPDRAPWGNCVKDEFGTGILKS